MPAETFEKVNVVTVTSWNELQDALFQDSWNPQLARYRSSCVFRGLSDADYRLETTLTRLEGDYVALERHLLRNFRKYAHRDVVERDSWWHWLTVAQHHGLPTRLLDWTYSPFVAMHFATVSLERLDVDGAIWAVDYQKSSKLLPAILRQELDREGSHVFTIEMLTKLAASFADFDALSEHDFVLFFEPPSMDARIVNQFALFSVASKSTLIADELFAKTKTPVATKIIIPSWLKLEVRDKLDQAGITERVLFPGLDGLSNWLKRHYSPSRSRSPEED